MVKKSEMDKQKNTSREFFLTNGIFSRSYAKSPSTLITGEMHSQNCTVPNPARSPVGLYKKDWCNDMADQLKMNQVQNEPIPKGNDNEHSKSGTCASPGSQRNRNDKRHVDITAMIRSLQRTEGLTDCFRSGVGDCDQLECAWRQYCLRTGEGVWTDGDEGL